MDPVFEKLTNTYHVEQLEGLEAVYASRESLGQGELLQLMPNIVRHLERIGYPAVVGKAIECLKSIMARNNGQLKHHFSKWNGVERAVATLSHSNADVRVACTVFVAQLARDEHWHDPFALARGYQSLVNMLACSEEREQLAGLVALRVFLQKESNISDFSRSNGFPTLFRLIRGEIAASPRVLGQALELLRATSSNRSVVMEIKSAKFENDILVHLSNVPSKVLDTMDAILDEPSAMESVRRNNAAEAILASFAELTNDEDNRKSANALVARLQAKE